MFSLSNTLQLKDSLISSNYFLTISAFLFASVTSYAYFPSFFLNVSNMFIKLEFLLLVAATATLDFLTSSSNAILVFSVGDISWGGALRNLVFPVYKAFNCSLNFLICKLCCFILPSSSFIITPSFC